MAAVLARSLPDARPHLLVGLAYPFRKERPRKRRLSETETKKLLILKLGLGDKHCPHFLKGTCSNARARARPCIYVHPQVDPSTVTLP